MDAAAVVAEEVEVWAEVEGQMTEVGGRVIGLATGAGIQISAGGILVNDAMPPSRVVMEAAGAAAAAEAVEAMMVAAAVVAAVAAVAVVPVIGHVLLVATLISLGETNASDARRQRPMARGNQIVEEETMEDAAAAAEEMVVQAVETCDRGIGIALAAIRIFPGGKIASDVKSRSPVAVAVAVSRAEVDVGETPTEEVAVVVAVAVVAAAAETVVVILTDTVVDLVVAR